MASAALIVPALQSEISAGATVLGSAAAWAAMPYSVTFKMEVENYTNQHLTTWKSCLKGGYIQNPPELIKPATKEAVTGHKTPDTATGLHYIFCIFSIWDNCS